MKASTTRRAIRMGDQIMREVSTLLIEDCRDPRIATVTISGVRMNANLRIAELLYTCSGGQDEGKEAQIGLEKAAGFLRSQVSRRLKLQYAPELRFIYDTFTEDMIYGKPGSGN